MALWAHKIIAKLIFDDDYLKSWLERGRIFARNSLGINQLGKM